MTEARAVRCSRTGPFGPWRSGAAGREQMAVGVADSVIYL
jgi:hypothetical protein